MNIMTSDCFIRKVTCGPQRISNSNNLRPESPIFSDSVFSFRILLACFIFLSSIDENSHKFSLENQSIKFLHNCTSEIVFFVTK